MADAEDLMLARERPERPTDDIAEAAADAGVHLIEDEHRRLVLRREHDLEREHDPRELAAGRHPLERPERLAGIRGDAEGDAVGAARVGLQRLERDGEPAAPQAEGAQPRLPAPRAPLPPPLPRPVGP